MVFCRTCDGFEGIIGPYLISYCHKYYGKFCQLVFCEGLKGLLTHFLLVTVRTAIVYFCKLVFCKILY